MRVTVLGHMAMLSHLWSRLHEILVCLSLSLCDCWFCHGTSWVWIWCNVGYGWIVTGWDWPLRVIPSVDWWMALIRRVGCYWVMSGCVWKVHGVRTGWNAFRAWATSSLWFEDRDYRWLARSIWCVNHRLYDSSTSINKPEKHVCLAQQITI